MTPEKAILFLREFLQKAQITNLIGADYINAMNAIEILSIERERTKEIAAKIIPENNVGHKD